MSRPAPNPPTSRARVVCPGCGDILAPGAGHVCDLGCPTGQCLDNAAPTPGFVVLLLGIAIGATGALLAVGLLAGVSA